MSAATADGTITSAVIVRIFTNGELDYHVFGGTEVRLFIVDENCPDDRVFEWTSRAELSEFRKLIPAGTVIGSSQDERHGAIAHVVTAALAGKPHLAPVK